MKNRPARKKVPKRIVHIASLNQGGFCACGCDEMIGGPITIDHDPPLGERKINADGTDYEPGQLDPNYLRIFIREHDRRKTYGSGGTTRVETRSGDIGRMAHGKRTKQKHEQHLAAMRAKHGQ